MTWAIAGSGTQTAVIGTEHTLATSSTTGTYVFFVDTGLLQNGDLVELRCYSSAKQTWKATYQHIQTNASKQSPPVVLTGPGRFTVKQTAGTGRSFPWSVRQQNAGSAVAYVGPGDIAGPALGWWGLRAFSYDKAGTKAVRIIRASDSAQQDFNTLSTGALDTASIATFLTSTTGKIVTLYDQSGKGFDITQATSAKQPAYSTSFLSGKPTITFTAANNTALETGTSWFGVTPPYCASWVAQGTSGAGLELLNTSNFEIRYQQAGANKVRVFDNSNVLDANATDGAFHAIQTLVTATGPGSTLYVDGTTTTATLAGVSIFSNTLQLGTRGSANSFDGQCSEIGLWLGTKSGDFAALNSNQHAFWGF